MKRDEKAAHGDEVDALLDAGYRYALSLGGDRSSAEDLLHDGWIALLQAGGPRKRGYLFRCIRSRFIDRYRRARVVVLDGLEDVESEPPDPDAEREMEAAVELRDEAVAAALAELRPEEREVIFLHAVEGYSASEIGELIERPRGSVLSMLHRARRKLRDTLQPQEAEA